jgi:hypothetical protein
VGAILQPQDSTSPADDRRIMVCAVCSVSECGSDETVSECVGDETVSEYVGDETVCECGNDIIGRSMCVMRQCVSAGVMRQ